MTRLQEDSVGQEEPVSQLSNKGMHIFPLFLSSVISRPSLVIKARNSNIIERYIRTA